MANLRLAYANLASLATITSNSEVATLPSTNLANDKKGAVWRSNNTVTAQIIASHASAKTVKFVALAFTNLTSSATMRVRGYTNAGDTVGVTSPAFDTTALSAVTAPYAARADNVGSVPGVNTFAYGEFTYAVLWFTGGSVAKIAIDLSDSTNPWAYLEASRLIYGDYLETSYQAEYGGSLTFTDNTKQERAESGDLLSDRSWRSRKLSLKQSLMPAADRKSVADILRVNGTYRPLFVSLLPGDSDKNLEESHQMYGKLTSISAMALSQYARYDWGIDIEEI